MEKFKKSLILIIILCIFLTAAFTACSSPKEIGGVAATAETDLEETGDTETDRLFIKDSLPVGLNFNGTEYRIFSSDGEDYKNKYIQGLEEITGDIVFDTVIERNQIVEERLNIAFKYFVFPLTLDKVAGAVRQTVMSGEDAYDLIVAGQFGTCQIVSEGLFVNIKDGKYFDFDQPWWNVNYMNEISIGKDKSFFMAGDYFIDTLRLTRLLYFNKSLWDDYFGSSVGNSTELYRMVLDGKWTFDAMTGFVKQVYRDLNGNSTHDKEDMYGYTTYWTGSSVDAFAFATDIEFTKRDTNGLISLTINNEKSVKFTEMLNNFFWCEGSFVFPISDPGNVNHFKSGISLFLGNATFYDADALREMELDYGALPNPKYDEAQKNYSSLVHDTANYGMIPITSDKLEMTSAVVEALCAESYRRLMPAYFETALKVKYVRDDISSEMIDLIHDSLRTNFIFAYYVSLNNVGSIFRTLVTNKSNDFVSEYSKIEKGALTGLEKLQSVFLDNN